MVFEEQRYLFMIIFCQRGDFLGRWYVISCHIQFLVGGWTLTSLPSEMINTEDAHIWNTHQWTQAKLSDRGVRKELV